MRFKKLGAAVAVAAALGAILASSALAAATTTDVQWYTGSGTGTLLSASETMSSAIVGAEARFTAHESGVLYVLKATGINCVNCKIENTGSTAIGSGELEFTGVSVVQPACTVAPTIKTKPLSVTADWMIGTTNYIRFEPTAGSLAGFISFPLSPPGPGCPTIVFKGTVFMESANATGIGAVSQELHSSAAIETAAGGSLRVATETASLAGSVKFSMSGAHAGQAFQTH